LKISTSALTTTSLPYAIVTIISTIIDIIRVVLIIVDSRPSRKLLVIAVAAVVVSVEESRSDRGKFGVPVSRSRGRATM